MEVGGFGGGGRESSKILNWGGWLGGETKSESQISPGFLLTE